MSGKDDENIKCVPLSELKMEEGAEEMMKSPEARLYIRAIGALMQENTSDPVFDELRQLPLEKRYVWRVVSALKWAFVVCDPESVILDRRMLSAQDMKRVLELVEMRPLQFVLFLKALLGEEAMEKAMINALRIAKAYRIPME